MSASPQVQARTGLGYHRWIQVSLPLFIAFAVAQMAKSSIGIIAANPGFSRYFGLNVHPTAIGWLTSWFLYSYGLSLLVWGFIVKKFGARASMLVGTAIWVVALGITPLTHTITQLYLTRILLGIGEACFYPVAHTLTARWFPIQERARANASWLVGIFVGASIASSITTVLLIGFGWRVAFLSQAAVALVFGFGMSLVLLRDDPKNVSTINEAELQHIEENTWEQTDLIPKKGAENPFANYRYWLTMLMYIGTTGPFYGIVAWLPKYLTNARHIHFGAMGTIMTVGTVAAIPIMIGIGVWSDRLVKRASLALVGFFIEGLGLALAAMVGNPILLGLFVFMTFAGNATCVVMNWSLLHSFMPTFRAETSSAVFSSLTNIAAAGIPALMGVLLVATHGYATGFAFIVGTTVISIVCCIILIPQGY